MIPRRLRRLVIDGPQRLNVPSMRAVESGPADGPRCSCGRSATRADGSCDGGGCCVDRSCTPDTCMRLPAENTCGHCTHERRCTSIFGMKPTDTECSFFPRRFRAKDSP